MHCTQLFADCGPWSPESMVHEDATWFKRLNVQTSREGVQHPMFSYSKKCFSVPIIKRVNAQGFINYVSFNRNFLDIYFFSFGFTTITHHVYCKSLKLMFYCAWFVLCGSWRILNTLRYDGICICETVESTY